MIASAAGPHPQGTKKPTRRQPRTQAFLPMPPYSLSWRTDARRSGPKARKRDGRNCSRWSCSLFVCSVRSRSISGTARRTIEKADGQRRQDRKGLAGGLYDNEPKRASKHLAAPSTRHHARQATFAIRRSAPVLPPSSRLPVEFRGWSTPTRCISRNSDGAMPNRRSRAWPRRADEVRPTLPAMVLSGRPLASSVRAASSRRLSTKCAGVLPVARVNLR